MVGPEDGANEEARHRGLKRPQTVDDQDPENPLPYMDMEKAPTTIKAGD